MMQLAWKNILFRKMRTLLTILGISSSIMLVILMSVMNKGTEKQFTEALGHMGGMVRIQPKSSALSGASTDTTPQGLVLTRETVAQVMQAAGGYDPAASSTVVMQALVLTATPNQPPVLVLNGIEPGHEAAVLSGVTMTEGAATLTGDKDVILGAGAVRELARSTGRSPAVGESLTLPGVPGEFTVRGIMKERDAFTDALAVVPLATAQKALKKGDMVSYVILSYPVEKAEAAARELQAKLPDVDVVTAGAMMEAINKAMTAQHQFMGMIQSIVYLTTVAILFMVMWTAVMERTREIGTMRALGAKRWVVVLGLLTEAVIFTLAGTLVAMFVGWLYMKSWKDHPNFVTPVEYLIESVRALAGALAVAAVSSLMPAVKAARVNPLESLRYE